MTDRPDVLIKVIKKSERDELRISLREYEGHRFFEARLYTRRSDGAMGPTKQGCSVKPELLADFIDGWQQAQGIARREGLVRG